MPVFDRDSDRFFKKYHIMLFASVVSLVAILLVKFSPGLNQLELLIIFMIIGLMSGAQTLGYSYVAEISSEKAT